MKSSLFILGAAGLAASSFHHWGSNSTTWYNSGQLTGTSYPSTQPTSISEGDCSSFMYTTVTSHSCTEYTTETVKFRPTSPPQQYGYEPEYPPSYTSYSTDISSAYSSACSSLGIIANTTTVFAEPTTITITETEVPSSTFTSSTTPALPTCTADTLTDPQNCGECGHICPTGICEAGSCSNFQCSVQSCGRFNRCAEDRGADCYCFSSTTPVGNSGFCGMNAICTGLTACASDSDCVAGSTGNICAVSTCCPPLSNEKPGVCLEGQCGNPTRKLAMMSRLRAAKGITAAF